MELRKFHIHTWRKAWRESSNCLNEAKYELAKNDLQSSGAVEGPWHSQMTSVKQDTSLSHVVGLLGAFSAFLKSHH